MSLLRLRILLAIGAFTVLATELVAKETINVVVDGPLGESSTRALADFQNALIARGIDRSADLPDSRR